MVKNNTPKPSAENDEVDIFEHLGGDDSGDILITSEESITITLFEDETPVEATDEEDDFETNIFSHKKKPAGEDDEDDFDSYFFEE
jgi:hypothetical protein